LPRTKNLITTAVLRGEFTDAAAGNKCLKESGGSPLRMNICGILKVISSYQV